MGGLYRKRGRSTPGSGEEKGGVQKTGGGQEASGHTSLKKGTHVPTRKSNARNQKAGQRRPSNREKKEHVHCVL